VRHPQDYYRTPEWAVQAIVPWLPADREFLSVLDAGAGDGAIADALPYGHKVHCSEQDPIKRAILREKGYNHAGWEGEEDFFNTSCEYDLIIMNPPYKQAMEFVQKGLRHTESGMLVALLRLPWLASQARAEFHRQRPSHVLVLPRRPSFTPDGKTDATDYAWFLWGTASGAKRKTRPGTWEILDLTK